MRMRPICVPFIRPTPIFTAIAIKQKPLFHLLSPILHSSPRPAPHTHPPSSRHHSLPQSGVSVKSASHSPSTQFHQRAVCEHHAVSLVVSSSSVFSS